MTVIQKYPWRLRSSMPASEMRSSARVAPRSVTRATAGLGDDVLDGERRRLDGGRARGVTDRAEAHQRLERLLALEHRRRGG